MAGCMISLQIVTNFHKLICVDLCRFVDDSTLRIFASFALLQFSTSTRLKSLNFSKGGIFQVRFSIDGDAAVMIPLKPN